jgi:predicted DNA-binding transcriptional regulator AlpA
MRLGGFLLGALSGSVATPPSPEDSVQANLSVRDVARLIGATAPSTVYRRLNTDPDFPRPFRVGTRTLVWDASEIRAYLEARRVTGPLTNPELNARREAYQRRARAEGRPIGRPGRVARRPAVEEVDFAD